MVRTLALFLALVSIPAHALTLGSNAGLVPVCNMLLSPVNLIHCFTRVSGSNNRSACSRAGDNAVTPSDYSAGKGTVGGANAANGKAFRVVAVQYIVFTAGTLTGPELWYADNDLGNTSGTAFTGGVNFIGVTNNNGYVGSASNATTANTTMNPVISCVYPNWLIPTGKFPSLKGDGTDVITAEFFGYEE